MPLHYLKVLPPGGWIMERATDALAIFAVLSAINPRLYQLLSDFSQLAALLMPIFGCIWLGVQIYRAFVPKKSGDPHV